MEEGSARIRLTSCLAFVLVVASACTSTTSEETPPRSTAATHEAAIGVTVAGIQKHLRALQDIADSNNGIRAAGEPGYDASVRYVTETLEKAGLDVSMNEFAAPIFEQTAPTTVRVGGSDLALRDGRDMKAMLYSPSGRVSAPLFTVDWDTTDEVRPGPGCDANGFDSVPFGAIVLAQPGSCFLRDQVIAAERAGASAVIFSFPEFTRDEGLRRPTLLSPAGIQIP
ncbi:MAG: hypothetical protein QOH90_882, partial [Actinomycetota bacterium]|nr:hypothetical protein [Actinomycetota bacterium]